ncbi:MAG: hypothetical protein KF767_18925 [Bdellovibrionaceae bacterium]|nr:hypothetical protein [Pseudobdellovibrionaceae bacterium]
MRILKHTTGFVLALFVAGPLYADSTTVFQQDVNVGYGQIQSILKEHLDSALNEIVRREGCHEVKSSEYRCGEMPFGKIVDKDRKLVLTIPKQDFKGKKGSVKYDLKGQKIPMYIYRNQKKGEITLSFLDDRKQADRATSTKLGDDIFLRLAPGGGNLVQDICLNIPGLRGYAENVTMRGDLRKNMSWPLPDVKAKLNVSVGVGNFDFDGAKICMSLLTKMDEKGLPVITLTKISEPSFTGMSHKGLKVKANANVGGFWGFVNGFLKWFGYDIEKIIASEVQKSVKQQASKEIKVTLNDVRSGKWFRDYVKHAQVSKVVEDWSKTLRKELVKNGWGKIQIEQAAQAACLASVTKMGLGGQELKDLLMLCLLTPKIQVQFFLNDADQRKQGCYSHYWDVRRSKVEGKRPWYLDECELVNRIRVTLDERMAPTQKCLLKAISEKKNPLILCEKDLADLEDQYRDGDFDKLIKDLKRVKPVKPTLAQLESLRVIAADRLSVKLPSAAELSKLWP